LLSKNDSCTSKGNLNKEDSCSATSALEYLALTTTVTTGKKRKTLAVTEGTIIDDGR